MLRSKVSIMLIKVNIASDILPDKEFESNSRENKEASKLIALGSVPFKEFELKLKESNPTREPIVPGIPPVKELVFILSAYSTTMKPIVSGMVPLIVLFDISNESMLWKLPIEVGNDPARLCPLILIVMILA